MADIPVTQPTQTGEPGFPVAAIVCIAIGGYVVLILILIIIRQVLLQRGMCRERCGCCGKEGELQCCECCVSCAESANCCKSPNITACLDSVCPARKHLDCVDIIMCECCANKDGGCCGSQEPLCDCCHTWWEAQCGDCECNTLHCCCFEISLAGNQQHQQGAQVPPGGGYPGYPPYPGAYGPPYGAQPGNFPPPPGGYYPGPGSDPFLASHGHRPLPGGAQPMPGPAGGYPDPSRMFMAQPQPQAHSSAAPF